MTDEELKPLIRNAQIGDGRDAEKVIKSFEPYIFTLSAGYYLRNYERDDFMQLGRLAVFKSIYKFNLNMASFNKYAKSAIRNNLNFEYRCHKKDKLMIAFADIENLVKSEVSSIKSPCNIEEAFIKKEESLQLYKYIFKLNMLEKDIIINKFYKGISLVKYSKEKNLKLSMVRYYYASALKKLKNNLITHSKGTTHIFISSYERRNAA